MPFPVTAIVEPVFPLTSKKGQYGKLYCWAAPLSAASRSNSRTALAGPVIERASSMVRIRIFE